MTAILKYPLTENELINRLSDKIHDLDLKYNCHDLYRAGIENETELKVAILKSIRVINQSGLAPQHHFKHIYITELDSGKTYSDWRMSRMGFLLTLIYSNANNHLINKWKIEILKLLE
jgi:hypothetical protein